MSDHSGTENEHQAALQSDDDKKMAHYEKIREDVRNEIKLRMRHRSRFAAHLITMLAILCSVAFVFANEGYERVLIVVPLLSVFYTMQILYSYRKHDVLARYLREVLEPELAKLYKISPEHEWQSYSYKHARPGYLRRFYLWTMWVACAGTMTYLWFNMAAGFTLTFYIFSGIYVIGMLYVTLIFMGDTAMRRRSRHQPSSELAGSVSGAYLS